VPVTEAPGSTKDSNSFEPRDEDKGRVARAMLYMDVRYDNGYAYGDFILGNVTVQGNQQMAKLSTLLEWNRLFPPDERERRRNHLIYSGNRNPFVDFPDLADAIFTSGERVAWGTWRWNHFSLDQLYSGDVTGELDDPDGDLLVNLLEYSANLDPNGFTQPVLMTQFRFPGFSIQLRYSRQKGWAQEGISYSIEKSGTPLREETWAPLAPEEITSVAVSDSGDMELVTTNLPDLPQPVYFRLAVNRTTSGGSAEASFDPVRSYDTTGSIFIYDRKVNGTDWRLSDWMGYVYDPGFPWIYHSEHGYSYVSASRDDAVWIYDGSLGWYYTSSLYYPWLFHWGSSQWLYFQTGSLYPDRWFQTPAGGWVAEGEL
jgi:hypothetical protein